MASNNVSLVPIGSNQTELWTSEATILFSYSTPVAACHNGVYYRTSRKYSNTTSKHITRWLDGRPAEQRDPEFFQALVNRT
jgi:hypothetical protein